jgi:pimeloyl-ACP methyl ester carboxylesterase
MTDIATDIDRFVIAIPQGEIDDLRERLTRTRWPDQLPGVGWEYGIPLDYVQELVRYWRTDYDWRVHEARMNQFPHFRTTLDGANVHFIHVRSPEPRALPLLMTHGWPGSIVEFCNIIEPLVDPRSHGGDPHDAFDLVVPSIPGYGFSGPTSQPGWNIHRIAKAWSELMRRLGYEHFGAQGGDWGSDISLELGLTDPEHVSAVHVNMLALPIADGFLSDSELTPVEQERLRADAEFRARGTGYDLIQSTRPQTLAYALTDSPVGQLAWIVEKFKEWTYRSERPEDSVDRDQMLTNVTLYWFTKTAGSSARLYFEDAKSLPWFRAQSSSTPTGVAVLPGEIAPAIRAVAERSLNIVHWSEFDRGGHFAAMEVPDLLVDDIRLFFRPFR